MFFVERHHRRCLNITIYPKFPISPPGNVVRLHFSLQLDEAMYFSLASAIATYVNFSS